MGGGVFREDAATAGGPIAPARLRAFRGESVATCLSGSRNQDLPARYKESLQARPGIADDRCAACSGLKEPHAR